MFTKDDLKLQLQKMGLKSTDTVLIHTSYKAVGEVEGGPEGFLDALCAYFEDGMFIVPTHTWANVNRENPVYNVSKTVPCIGLIPRTAAFRPDGIRSLHPTHSIWVHGKDAADFIANEEKAETPAPVGFAWWKLAEVGAKILMIGTKLTSNTFIHAIDEVMDMPNRITPNPWEVTIIDQQGKALSHPFHHHCGHPSNYFGNFEVPFAETGVQTYGTLGDAAVRVIDARKCMDLVCKIYQRADVDPCSDDMVFPEAWWRD